MIRILRNIPQCRKPDPDHRFAIEAAFSEAVPAQHDDALSEVLRLGLLYGITGETLLTII